MQIEVSNPNLVADLVSFLQAMGYVARADGAKAVTAFLPLAPEGWHERTDAALLLRTWSGRREADARIV